MSGLRQPPAIDTPRLQLRAPALGDAARIAELCADFDIPRMTTRMPWPYRLQDAESFLAAMEKADARRDRIFAVTHPDHGLIGMVGLHQRERMPELGYWLGKAHWGKGYATEAVAAALAWARDVWKRKVVEAGHFADNPASGNVLIKNDFLYTGDVPLKRSEARGADVPVRQMVWIA